MSDIEIPLKEELRGRNIQKILFNPKLSKLFIFQNNKGIMMQHFNRRVTIITFPNRFEGAREDKQFIAKLTTESEKSGIFNILMNAFKANQTNKDIYVNEKTIEERRLKYLRAHNSIRAFMGEVIDCESSNEEAYIPKSDLHLVYSIYCSIYMIPVENYDMFCRPISKTTTITIDREETQITIYESRKSLAEKNAKGEPKQTHCWTSIRLSVEYQRELLEAKAKADKDTVAGQQRLDD
jgi:penicillin-binding protein-related factor A (putative recombinase)